MNTKSANTIRIIACCIGILAGVLALYWGYALSGSGASSSYAKFGADFYTEIYDATRNAANNLRYVIEGLGHLLMATGLFMIGWSAYKIGDCLPATDAQIEKEKTSKSSVSVDLPDLDAPATTPITPQPEPFPEPVVAEPQIQDAAPLEDLPEL